VDEAQPPDVAVEELRVADLVARALVATSLVRTVAVAVLLAAVVVLRLRTLKQLRSVYIIRQARDLYSNTRLDVCLPTG
jgi:hypothetical protein